MIRKPNSFEARLSLYPPLPIRLCASLSLWRLMPTKMPLQRVHTVRLGQFTVESGSPAIDCISSYGMIRASLRVLRARSNPIERRPLIAVYRRLAVIKDITKARIDMCMYCLYFVQISSSATLPMYGDRIWLMIWRSSTRMTQ